MGFAFIICALILFVFSVYIGFSCGNAVGQRLERRGYWTANIAAILVAAVLFVIIASLPLLYAVVIGLLGGVVAGLKMGFGESVGPWRHVDERLGVNKDHLKAREDGSAARRRERKRTGDAGPDLISTKSNNRTDTR